MRVVPGIAQGSTLTRFADLALGVVIPIHSHIAVNGVISDYVPKTYIGEHPSSNSKPYRRALVSHIGPRASINTCASLSQQQCSAHIDKLAKPW